MQRYRQGNGKVVMRKTPAFFCFLAVSMSGSAIAQSTGTCTATQHRGLQNTVDSSCGAALACSGTDDRAALNAKIGKHSACIDARKAINNMCFAGGDAGHRQAITERTNAITNCQNLLAKVK
jgi:Novel toxin 16